MSATNQHHCAHNTQKLVVHVTTILAYRICPSRLDGLVLKHHIGMSFEHRATANSSILLFIVHEPYFPYHYVSSKAIFCNSPWCSMALFQIQTRRCGHCMSSGCISMVLVVTIAHGMARIMLHQVPSEMSPPV